MAQTERLNIRISENQKTYLQTAQILDTPGKPFTEWVIRTLMRRARKVFHQREQLAKLADQEGDVIPIDDDTADE